MIASLLSARIREYSPADAIEQENVLQELMQHYVLASLSRAGLFSEAVFHGGTCLRIVHGMSRFSEDLDFLLKRPDPGFTWTRYLEAVARDCAREGIEFDVKDTAAARTTVRKAFLTTDSLGKVPPLSLPFDRPNPRKIRIKLEVDTNPPAGVRFQTSYITFPATAVLTTQTLPSGFGTKCHALFCRRYLKGRDWYDFAWYAARRIAPDLTLFQNALLQQGPWAGRLLEVTRSWYLEQMTALIGSIRWEDARQDVRRFLPAREQEGLGLWSREFFLDQLARVGEAFAGD